MIETNEDVAAKVRGCAAEKRISQAQLADALSLSKMQMHRRYHGELPYTPAQLIRISRLVESPVSRFFGERAS